MLQSMRQGAQSTAAKIIIGLIVLSFAAFGLETLLPAALGHLLQRSTEKKLALRRCRRRSHSKNAVW